MAAVIRELHVNAEIFLLQLGNDLLQRIAIAPSDSHDISLNRRLDFYFRIFDDLNDFFCLLLRNSLLDVRTLTYSSACCRLSLVITESLERHASTYELLLENIVHVPQLRIVFRSKNEIFVLKFDLRCASLKIKALVDLLHRLVDCVGNLGTIHLGNDVERILLSHAANDM